MDPRGDLARSEVHCPLARPSIAATMASASRMLGAWALS
jgi:hypothetical protein